MFDKRVLGIVIVIVIVGAVWWLFSAQENEENTNKQSTVGVSGITHTVLLTEEGYVPEELTIEEGDTVVFTTELNKPHWPASNLHPSHRDYSEFDPKRPVSAQETWGFTFGQTGEWGFHDHLAPYHTGVIIVK